MAARIVEVRNGVVARVAAWWEPAAPDEVSAPWDLDLDTGKMKGRKVQVFPSTYTGGPVTRGQDQDDYTLVVLVAEVFEPSGDIPPEWVDERVAWCESLLDLLGDPRAERLLAVDGAPDSGLWPETAECTTVYDLEELTERKLFLSVLTITYREHAE